MLLRGSVGVVARVLERLGVSDQDCGFVPVIISSKIGKNIRNSAGRRPTVAPIIAGCFDCVMSDDRSDIMRGRACLDGRCHKTVPLAVPNNVGDRRVTNNLGNL